MISALIACLCVGKLAGQSLVDDAKHHSTGPGDRDLLDIRWMLVGHRVADPSRHMLAVSYDNKTLVSAGNIDMTLKIWDLERHVLKRTIVAYELNGIKYVDLNRDGTQVLAGSEFAACIYNTKSGQLIRKVNLGLYVDAAKLTSAGTLACLDDKHVTLIDPATGKHYLEVKKILPNDIPISPDRRFLFVFETRFINEIGSDGNTFQAPCQFITWTSMNGSTYDYTVSQMVDPVDQLVSCLDQNYLVTLDKQYMRLDRLGYRSKVYSFSDRIPDAVSVDRIMASSDGGTFLVSVRSSRTKRIDYYIYDSESLNLNGIISGTSYSDMENATSGYSSRSLALSRLGLFVYAGNSEYRGGVSVARPPVLELWGVEGKRTRGYLDNGSAICDTAISEDGKIFAYSLTEGRIKFYDRATAQYLKFLDCPRVFWNGLMAPAPMSDLVITKDFVAGASPGPYVFVKPMNGGEFKGKHLIDPETGWSDRPVMCGYDEGKKILVTTPRSTLGLRMMETVSGKLLKTYEPKVPLNQVLRAGKYVVGASSRRLYVWDIESGKLENKIDVDFSAVSTITAYKDKLYAGGFDGKIECFDLLTGKKGKEFIGHEATVIALAVSPNGKTLVSRSDDAGEEFPMRTWDVESAKLLAKYGDEVGPMERTFIAGNSIRFTPDGKYFIFGRGDGSVVYVKLDTTPPKETPIEMEKPKI